MDKRLSLVAVALAAALSGCSSTPNAEALAKKQALIDNLASNLQVKYELVTNDAPSKGVDCQALGADWAACNLVNLKLTHQGSEVDADDWAIYLHSIRRILRVDNDEFTITHLTGDLYKLEPTSSFGGFEKGETVEVPLVMEYWQLFETDVMPNWYIASPGTQPKAIASMSDINNARSYTEPFTGDKWKRTKDDNNVLMGSVTRFNANKDSVLLPKSQVENQILPTPLKQEIYPGQLNLSSINLKVSDLPKNQAAAIRKELVQLGATFSESGTPVTVKIWGSKVKQAEGYDLTIDGRGVTIHGADAEGAYWGVQSLLSLLAPNDLIVSHMKVEDAPRFAYRGMQTDVARHFRSKEVMMRLIDQMSAMKLNKLHLGLTNDEGWRLEIPGLPELTQVGGKRCHDLDESQCLLPQLGSGPTSNNRGSGFYSRSDYIELVRYARDHGIEVIPEINMPAHARAAVMSMEARYRNYMAKGMEKDANEFRLMDPNDTSNVTSIQFYNRQSMINSCLPSATNFVTKVMEEVALMHQEAGQPLTTWHYGGDETKNIMLGAGFQDFNTKEADKVAWKGNIDMSKEDKPFAKSPICQDLIAKGEIKDVAELPSWFAKRVGEVVNNQQIDELQAWQDGLKYVPNAAEFATKKTTVNFWDTLYWGGFNEAYKWANNGYGVVLSNPDYLYFDFPYEVNPQERGYYWGTRFNDTRKAFAFAPENLPQNAETSVDRDGNAFVAKGEQPFQKFDGISGQQWGETVRTDEQFEYMVYPRIFSLAERAWHKANWELDYVQGREFSGTTKFVDKQALAQEWNQFANLIGQRVLPKLDQDGVAYRLSVPGAGVADGLLYANVDLPGLIIQYSTDGDSWMDYDPNNKPQVSGKVWVRTISFDRQRTSRVTIVN